MPERKIRTYGRPGYRGDDSAFLTVERRSPDPEHGPLNFKQEVVAEFVMRYLPDTNEVVVLHGDEIVYSEILDD